MTDYRDAVAGWYDALRSGSSDTWTRWLESDPRPGTAARDFAATGAQLELVRRLAATGPVENFAALADEVVKTAAVGRGRVENPLPWPDGPANPLATAPEELPPSELMRVAIPVVGALATRMPDPPAPPESPRAPIWRQRFQVHGAPTATAVVRRGLRQAGLREGPRNAIHLVITGPFDALMFDLWTTRVAHGGAMGWPRLWQTLEAQPHLPPRLDTPALLGGLEDEIPAKRVHVVVVERPSEAMDAAAEIFGVARPAIASQSSWAAVDLRRRVNRLFATSGDADERRRIGRRIGATIESHPLAARTDVPPVPEARLAWASQAGPRLAERIADQVATGGYAVHGDLGRVARMSTGVPDTDANQTLELAVAAIVGGWPSAGAR